LYDIYQDGGVDKLARPVPVFARPRYWVHGATTTFE
jgi:hypothetical protein